VLRVRVRVVAQVRGDGSHVVELIEVALGASVDVELLGPLDEGVCTRQEVRVRVRG
tara:strand:- start:1906 stop:2073 length:168 start_codon:yes stop_codon:yes gene_type:complete